MNSSSITLYIQLFGLLQIFFLFLGALNIIWIFKISARFKKVRSQFKEAGKEIPNAANSPIVGTIVLSYKRKLKITKLITMVGGLIFLWVMLTSPAKTSPTFLIWPLGFFNFALIMSCISSWINLSFLHVTEISTQQSKENAFGLKDLILNNRKRMKRVAIITPICLLIDLLLYAGLIYYFLALFGK
ncbi:hypothetical protein [Oenococcus kitaharae]|uniref:Uncharacterized protein n=1 Tax=Oenococcus kitaharae DSM 17330 TaxID=1045004 RepID=G9WGG6_9LACO|nr:hypothetical protein [Oenococcus kitaharae]EHN59793.1 hypothetical protein OKIT_1718 [Oenococcus kitaharae DSM 17330]OEY83612.1 hypothetical protein NT95_05795 [Oenococcus kitaharae]OEY85410.1 hypothetical protein NT96_02240 [Oenococcus kitaharae]OEY86263.1 hypothetical protein NV75_02190 [Oenococcus kitaharae]